MQNVENGWLLRPVEETGRQRFGKIASTPQHGGEIQWEKVEDTLFLLDSWPMGLQKRNFVVQYTVLYYGIERIRLKIGRYMMKIAAFLEEL